MTVNYFKHSHWFKKVRNFSIGRLIFNFNLCHWSKKSSKFFYWSTHLKFNHHKIYSFLSLFYFTMIPPSQENIYDLNFDPDTDFLHCDLENGDEDWLDSQNFLYGNINILEAGFLGAFDYPTTEILPLDVEENHMGHICNPAGSDEFIPHPPCDECFKASRPALFKILSLGKSLKAMVFPHHSDYDNVYPSNLIVTKIPPGLEIDKFLHEIDVHIFQFVRDIVVRPGTFYFDIILKLKLHYDEVMRTLNDTFWPTIYTSLYFSDNIPDVQRIVHHIARYRIIALRIAILRLKTILDSFKGVYAMHSRCGDYTPHEALIMAHLEAKEYTYIPLSVNYQNASQDQKKNSFFSIGFSLTHFQ